MQQDKVIKVDAGTYLPKLVESVPEIAARSRSQHKSQGFGSSGSRASYDEQLELLKGDDRDADNAIFANLDISWTRVEGGANIGKALAAIEANFNFDDPSTALPDLLRVRTMMKALPDGYWKHKKLAELEEVVAGILGLYLFAGTNDPTAAAGQEIDVELEATNRTAQPVNLVGFRVRGLTETTEMNAKMDRAKPVEHEFKLQLPLDMPSSSPYWLQDSWKLGMYTVKDQLLRGKGESDDPIIVEFDLDIAGQAFTFARPLRYSFTDPVKGEQVQPFEVMQPVFTELGESSYLFTQSAPSPIRVKVTAGKEAITGTVELCTPEGWNVQPAKIDFSLERKGQEQVFTFDLTPPEGQENGMIVPLVRLDGMEEGFTRKLVKIDHDHIPTQLAELDASVPVAKLDLKIAGQEVGYLPGAGDAIPEALTNIGFNVTTLEDSDFTSNSLDRFDAIVVGIRAYNVLDQMPNYHPRLLEYVKQGGTLVIQYNTSRRLKIPQTEIGPYPLQLSRDRVTVEEAEVRMLAPDHPVLNYPNKITEADFDGWVQERGLYFPNNWSEEYTAILSSNDPGEPARDGGLLVAEYGEGHFVYTGYSFFRELPAGVPGAYRLFANLVGLGNEVRP
jgi:hypothetical protein